MCCAPNIQDLQKASEHLQSHLTAQTEERHGRPVGGILEDACEGSVSLPLLLSRKKGIFVFVAQHPEMSPKDLTLVAQTRRSWWVIFLDHQSWKTGQQKRDNSRK